MLARSRGASRATALHFIGRNVTKRSEHLFPSRV